MGFLDNTFGINVVAKLTPAGRAKVVTNSNNLITHFKLGDSDAYYGVYQGLQGGEIPTFAGNAFGQTANNGGVNYVLRSVVKLNATTDKKPVDTSSININTSVIDLGYRTINYSDNLISQDVVEVSAVTTDRLTNLFYSFGLPITSNDLARYTTLTRNQGGLLDTAMSAFGQTKILVIGIDNDEYGELIDGKSIELNLTTTASSYTIYSTFQNTNSPLTNLDSQIYETSVNLNTFGPNRALLFSDTIQQPNNDGSKSWSTGYAQNKPFSIHAKELWNYTTNSNLGRVADKPVGIAYLDKGFLVITDPTIVDSYNPGFSGATGTSISYSSIRYGVSQSITCVAGRGQFNVSTNPTFSSGDVPRITEIGLYDNSNTLIAIGKLTKTYEKPGDDFIAFNVKIDY